MLKKNIDKNKLENFTDATCSDEEIVTEAKRLVEYITKLVGVDINEMTKEYKLNPNNVVHILGICGSIVSDIIMRDYAKLNNELQELRGPAPLPPIEEIKEE
tara:strand:+ start:34 stop:339 length:306 start_codon:yes stop_codon:yes gene_type:complete